MNQHPRDLSLEFKKTNIEIRIDIFEILCVCVYVWVCLSANYQVKQTAMTFSAQICHKKDVGLEILKTNAGIRISILDMLCVFSPSLPKNGFRVENWEN